jgi:diguanylate cyclase (GGDEF)-like protein
MLDLDHFKRVNDNYGHAKGDEVLIRTAAVIRSRVRQAGILARLGGRNRVVSSQSS